MFTLLIVVIAIALIFDLVNGFHDAANSIATVVSTKVLTPLQAVIWVLETLSQKQLTIMPLIFG